MIGMNIRVLRKKYKLSQEVLAERVNVSRQTVAKWESGEALPDIYKCQLLADIFQITLDQLSKDMSKEELDHLAPKGKHFFGVVKVGERGQIVIPKEARKLFQIQAGDKLMVLGEDDSKGLAILKTDRFLAFADIVRDKEQAEEELE
ncbi:helix-turn-helix domain-containing protein [Oceanobacillus bengalensis]|uniref:Helix-turn-helix domain-containing protein n=1 Tax=Oceanobacillus bengalensis TaxID=1435466 RepID=A0A494Z7G3_9BACI|nr:helix-turn-helix domain-containing protein [Oceanobacillus bengalensis]RKQ18550.1 helix-turn-helix domain-containing protein [Oceanobacillus bengalensis]